MAKQTLLTKRRLIESAGKMVFVWVAIAAAVVSLALVALQFVYQDFQFNNDIIAAKFTAVSTLEKNIVAVDELDTNIKRLIANGDLSKAKAYPDEDNLAVILDALPSNKSSTDLPAGLQKVISPKSGVTLVSITVPSGEAIVTEATETSATVQPMEQIYAVEIAGNYDSIKKFLQQIEHSIRPIYVMSIDIQGASSNELRANMTIKTYYQPSKSVTITREGLKK